MSDPERPSPEDSSLADSGLQAESPEEARQNAVSSPLPADLGDATPLPPQDGSRPPGNASSAVARALARPTAHPQHSSGLQRAMAAIRVVLPVVQKVLPLLDGNIASVVSNILVSRPQTPSHPANLAPVESALARLHVEQRELRGQVAEQNASLKRVAEQLEMVKGATNRNTLEQQELMEDLDSIRKKVKVFAWAGLGLLVLSILVNVILFLRLQRIVP